MVEVNAINAIQNRLAGTSYKSSGPSKPSGSSGSNGNKIDNTNSSAREIRDKIQLSISKNSSYAETSLEQLEDISEKINNFLKNNKRHLSFNVELGKGLIAVEVISDETGEVIRKIPPDAWARMANGNRIAEMVEILSS